MGLIATFGATGFLVTALLAWIVVMAVAARSFETPTVAAKSGTACPVCRKTLQGTLVMRRPQQLRPVHARPRTARPIAPAQLLDASA